MMKSFTRTPLRFRLVSIGVTAVLLVGSLLLHPTAATAAKKPKPPAGKPVSFQTVMDLRKMTDTVQKCGVTTVSMCIRVGFIQLEDTTGDIAGQGLFSMSQYQFGRSVGFSGTVLYDNVTVKGCGSGSMIVSTGPAPGEPTRPDRLDPSLSVRPALWVIHAASGDLAGIRGEGLLYPDTISSPTMTISGAGRIHCGK